MFVLVYVDDIVYIRNNQSLMTQIINQLFGHFLLKDMGSLSYFLVVEVSYTPTELFFVTKQIQ